MINEALKPYLADNSQAWEMDAEGHYKRHAVRGAKAHSAQAQLLEQLAGPSG